MIADRGLPAEAGAEDARGERRFNVGVKNGGARVDKLIGERNERRFQADVLS
jgi:hypothetical protein